MSDSIVVIVGTLMGGFIMNALGFATDDNIIYSILVAFIGECILIAILRAVSRSTRRV